MIAQSRTESTRDIYNYGQSIPAEYNKSNTAIRTDPEENIKKENVYYVQCNLY